jgi:hypothetical protein
MISAAELKVTGNVTGGYTSADEGVYMLSNND